MNDIAFDGRLQWRARFWADAAIPPQKKLADLHDLILARSEKRSPKWRFRLAADLVIELQPKVSKTRFRFEGLALQATDASAADLIGSRSKIERDYLSMAFALTGDDRGWRFRPGRIAWKGRVEDYPNKFDALKDRVLAAFHGAFFDELRPDAMLAPACLVCGRALIDPVSQARLVGPECAGTASASLPFQVLLTGTRGAA